MTLFERRDFRLVFNIKLTVCLGLFLVLMLFGSGAFAQETSGDFSPGSVRIGYDSTACSGSIEGAVRYNSSNGIEYCDGSSWVAAGGGGYTLQCPSSTGLVGHFKFDESSGTTATNSTGNGDGTLTNGPVWQPTGGKIGGALLIRRS